MKTLEERFMKKFYVAEDGCWVWTATRNGDDYGMVHDGEAGRMVMAHRVSYELHIGPIPEGQYIDHLCRNRGCVNPAHLEPVTHRENTLRGRGIAAINAAKTHCKHGHEFTEDNTYVAPSHPRRRECRTCMRSRNKKKAVIALG